MTAVHCIVVIPDLIKYFNWKQLKLNFMEYILPIFDGEKLAIHSFTGGFAKFSQYIEINKYRTEEKEVLCMYFLYDILYTHSNENPTVCPVSSGFEFTTSCICYRISLLAAQTSAQPTRPSSQP